MLVLLTFLFRRTASFVRRRMPPPDRWDVYQPLGSVIPGTKFIAFKVPLKEELLQQVEDKDRFSPTILMNLLNEKGLKLGGVIDLTFTFKYYNREEFLKNSVGHRKVFTPGHTVPSESVFQEFAHAVKTFDANDDDHVIGVHCTHGVNRTGYLICRYMIEEMSFEPDNAIDLFGKARGHELERENYLEDLRSRKRGQSTYDPDFKVQDVDYSAGRRYDHQNPRRAKPRWRNHKEDHPEWQRKYHHRTDDRGMRCASDSNNSPLDEQAVSGSVCSKNLGSTDLRNDWAYGNYHTGDRKYSGDRSARYSTGNSDHYWGDDRRSRDVPIHGSSDPSWGGSSHPAGRSIHESSGNWRDNLAGSNPANESFNPKLTSRGRKWNNNGNYYGSRFNPGYKGPDADRTRRIDHRHHDKDTDSKSSHDQS